MHFLNWLKKRLLEPSTHGTLTGVMAVASGVFPQYATALQALAAVFAAFGLGLPETGGAGGSPGTPASAIAWIPPVHIASNPHLADAINVGVQAAITHLLTPPAKK